MVRRYLALLSLFLFLLPATGASAELIVCDDCLQMAVFSCCAIDASKDECEERCGSCEDDTTISVRAILARKGSQTETSDHTVWTFSTPGLFKYISVSYGDRSPDSRSPQVTIPRHISTTVLLS